MGFLRYSLWLCGQAAPLATVVATGEGCDSWRPGVGKCFQSNSSLVGKYMEHLGGAQVALSGDQSIPKASGERLGVGQKSLMEVLGDQQGSDTPCPLLRSATATSTWRSGCGGTCGGAEPCWPMLSWCWRPRQSPGAAGRSCSSSASR